MTYLPHLIGTDLKKLKHELSGSLGVIKMLSSALLKDSSNKEKTQKFLRLIDSLAARNIKILADLNTPI